MTNAIKATVHYLDYITLAGLVILDTNERCLIDPSFL
jgi:hypothetical protein